MPDSSELLQQIQHCQKSVSRYSQNGNDSKMLYYILKLFKMPITVSHLEETGVGRTVNSLRKLKGEAGDAARALVAKWKQMVSGNDEYQESEPNDTNAREESNNGHREIEEKKKDTDSSHKHSDKVKVNGTRDKHSKDNRHKASGESERSTSETRHKSSANSHHKSGSSSKEKHHKSESEYSSVEDSSSESDSQSSTNENNDSGSESDKERKHKYVNKKSSHKSSKSEEKDNKEQRKSHSSHSENDKKHKHHSSSSSSERKHNDSSTTKDSTKKRKRENSRSDDETDRKSSKKSSHNSHTSSTSHRSSESSQNSSGHREHKDSRDTRKDMKHMSDKKEAKSSSSSSSKDDIKSEKRKHDSYKDDRQKFDDKSKKEYVKSEKSSNSNKDSKDRSSKSNKPSPKTSSASKKTVDHVDIGSESGTSFADALGMLEPPKSSKSPKKSVNQKPPESSHKVEKPEKSEKKEKYSKEKPSKSEKIEVIIPPPPPQKMDIDISSLLPSITPNYRPVSNSFVDANSRNKMMNEDEALSMVMSQKNMRTKVYSGNKALFGSVPTLFELCIRILQDNIDALEYTGGVPYAILKPILDKATPDQLFMLEHHNPYLIEDTDNNWQFHCSKEFRNKKRVELESWREMYMRCLDEREAKLKALTENIKLAQDKSTPVRQTKLAYVDSVVKPPRDVLRKQVKNGIDKKPIITPTSKLNSIVSAGSAGQVAVPNHVRASSSGTSSSTAAAKQKKAPLMQKTLAFLKGNRFRR